MLVVAHVVFWRALACASFWWASGKLLLAFCWCGLWWASDGLWLFFFFGWWTFSELFVGLCFFHIVLFTKPALAGLNSRDVLGASQNP